MKTDKATRQQRHQAQVKTQQGSAIRGAQSTEFVKGAGYRKTEFIGGKKYYSPMSSDPTSSGAGGGSTSITLEGASFGAGGDIRSDGTVHFTAPQTGVTPTATSHLTTKAYVDSNAITTSTYTTGTHNPGDGNVDLQSIFESSTKLYALQAGSNIELNVVSPSSGDDYLQIRSTVNTAGFLSTSANNIVGVRSFDAGSIDWTQQNANGYITFDADGSNVAFSNVTVDSDNKPAVRITAPANTNTQNVFTSSWVDSSNDCLLRLTKSGASSGTQDIKIVAGSNVQLTPSGTNLTISSTDTNTTVVTSTENTGGDFISLLEDSDTIRALKAGSGINITVEGQADGEDVIQIASTVNTSGLLTNGIVSVQDHDGGSVGNFANASGADKLEFRDGGNITWTVSGPTSDVIKVQGSVPNNTDTNYYLTGLSFSGGTLTGTVTGASNPSVSLDGRYLQANQTITLSGDASGSGTTSISVTVADDSHNHIIGNVDGLQSALDAKAALAGATFTGGVACNGNTSNYPHLVVGGTGRIVSSSAALQVKGFVRLANHMLLHETNSSANAVGLTYANHNLSVYASSGTTAENSGQANFHVPGDVIAYYSSDPRLKENETKISKPLEKLKYINGYMFDWKKEAEAFNVYNTGRDIGVMADEIEAVLPEVVEERANGYKAVKYEKIIPLLIECVKEQQLQIDAMRKM